MTVGMAVLGTGRWGIHLVRNFLAHPQARVVAIADLNVERLRALSEQLSSKGPCLFTTDWRAAIATPGVEAVAIATPASTHTPLIRAALTVGLHVLVEKPMTLDVDEAIDLCALAERQQRCLMVDHTYLFHPAVTAGRTLLQTEGLGDLYYGYASRTHLGPVRSDVDALWDLAIHDIAIFNHWLGDRPYQVQAWGTVWLQRHGSHPEGFPKGLSDVVWVRLFYPSGFQATLHLCWLNPDKQRRLCLVGREAALVFDEMQSEHPLVLLKGHLRSEGRSFHPEGQSNQSIQIASAEPLERVCAHFIEQVRQSIPSAISDGAVGLDLIRVLVALSASLNQDGRVVPISYS